MDNQVIIEVDSHKHLGVFLSNDCTWHKHIDYVKEKAWDRINVMRRLKFCLDRKSLETIYLTFIRPIIEYVDVACGNCTNYEKQELDKIQRYLGLSHGQLNLWHYIHFLRMLTGNP